MWAIGLAVSRDDNSQAVDPDLIPPRRDRPSMPASSPRAARPFSACASPTARVTGLRGTS
eukprot:7196110-Pyramimonas_sp.AAC.1